PVIERPVLPSATTAYVQSNNRLRQSAQKLAGELLGIIAKAELWNRVLHAYSESLDRPHQLSSSMGVVLHFGWTANDLLHSSLPQICFENSIRIEQIADHEIETAEVAD